MHGPPTETEIHLKVTSRVQHESANEFNHIRWPIATTCADDEAVRGVGRDRLIR